MTRSPSQPPLAAVATPRFVSGRWWGAALLAASLLAPTVARAAALKLIAADPGGVTIQLDIDAWTLEAEGEGRAIPVVDGLARTDDPGRPRLPFAATLIALPPGMRATARVIAVGAEETRETTPIAVAAKPEFVPDEKLGPIPVLTPQAPLRDGEWPREVIRLGEEFSMRERRLVPVQVHPFRYDEATARLVVTRSITVRVDFTGAGRVPTMAGLDDATDPQFDPVFATQVLNWEQGRGWRATRPLARDRGLSRTRDRAAGTSLIGGPVLDAFDETEPEVRVRIDTTGVYALEYDSLSVYGYPAGVPIGEVSVHRHEFVEDQTPPYVTIDLPIEVEDDGDGFFGSGDRIVVWVWEWAQRSRASTPQRVWGNAEVIYATRRAGAARIEHRSGWLGRTDLIPLASYPTRRRYERNVSVTRHPADTTQDVFTWNSFNFFCTEEPFGFQAHDIDLTVAPSLTLRWLGLNSTPHIHWARVRNGLNQFTTVLDSVTWFGITEETRTAVLPPGAFTEGANTLLLKGKTVRFDDCADTPIVVAGFNWFDVSYWRRFTPIQRYLACNSAAEASDFEIRAGPFLDAGALRAYDVTDSTRPFRLDNVDISTVGPDVFLRLQDTAGPSLRKQYVVFEVPRSPAPGAMRAVTRTRIFDRTAGDYLVVVPEGFQAAVQPLVDLHEANGLRVVVAPLEGIQDEFNGGRKSPYAIRRFIRYAYNNWNARFVLLVGDGSEDPNKLFSSSSPDIIPVQMMFGPVPVPVGTTDYLPELIPSDFWYVWCLNCPTRPANSLKPDLFIGRLPAGNLTQLNALVAKLTSYDNLGGDQAWRRRMLLMADDAYSGATTFGGGGGGSSNYCLRPGETVFRRINVLVDSLVRKVGGLGQSEVELFNLSYYVPNRAGEYTTSGGADTCRINVQVFQTRARATATPELFSRLNAGRFWWNYQGHANEYVMAHENFYVNQTPTDDKVRLTNDGHPFLFTAFSCHPNSFGRIRGGNDPIFGPAFGEDLVMLPNKGAIASWASVGFEQLPAEFSQHLNVYLAQAMFVNPPRDEYLGDRGSRQILGELLYVALLANHTARAGSIYERDVAVTYTLLGDPATRLSIGAPQALVTANGQTVTSGQDIRLTTTGPNVLLDANLVSTVRLDSLRLDRVDASGTTTLWKSSNPSLPPGLTVTPPFPDTSPLTSQFGGRRFRLQYDDALRPASYRYVYRTWDRYGLQTNFEAVFSFQAILRVGGQAISDGDIVAPTADLSLLVLSPKPLVPGTDLTLMINGNPQVFTPTPANGDLSGREWILSWTHDPYGAGDYGVDLAAVGGGSVSRTFRVAETGAAVRLVNAMAFPNPFDEDYLRELNPGRDAATVFSFDLISATPADVTLRVYSMSGRLIYQRTERRLDPRWHQIGWNGLDAEGYPLANGVYFYKLLASNGTGTAVHEGRLVKLRRPRRLAPVEENN